MTLRAALALTLAALLFPPGGLLAQGPAEEAEPVAESRQILVVLHMPAPHYRPNARYGGRYDDRAAQAARLRLAAGIARATTGSSCSKVGRCR